MNSGGPKKKKMNPSPTSPVMIKYLGPCNMEMMAS